MRTCPGALRSQGVRQHGQAIGADPHRQFGALILGLGQPVGIHARTVAGEPVGRREGTQPVRLARGDRLQRRAQRFADQLQPLEITDRAQHMGGIGAHPPARTEQIGGGEPVEHRIEQQRLRATGLGQPGTELAEHRRVKPLIGELQAQQVLPVNPTPNAISGLLVSQAFDELQNADNRQSARRGGRAPALGEQIGEVLVCEQRTEHVPQTHTERRPRKRRPRHPHRLDRDTAILPRPQGHHRHQPSSSPLPIISMTSLIKPASWRTLANSPAESRDCGRDQERAGMRRGAVRSGLEIG